MRLRLCCGYFGAKTLGWAVGSWGVVREPQGNGIAERIVRILKENLLWIRSFQTIEGLRLTLLAFKETHNRR